MYYLNFNLKFINRLNQILRGYICIYLQRYLHSTNFKIIKLKPFPSELKYFSELVKHFVIYYQLWKFQCIKYSKKL